MPKGDIVTTIPNGQKLKVEWHLGYAHRGGFKIELINDKGQTDIDFTQDFVGSENIEVSFILFFHLYPFLVQKFIKFLFFFRPPVMKLIFHLTLLIKEF